MPLPLSGITDRQRIDLTVPGPDNANRLLIYTGSAVLNPSDTMWVINDAVAQDSVEIVLGSASISDPGQGDNFNDSPLKFLGGSATVSLAGVSDQGNSDKLEWFLNGAQLDLVVVSNSPVTKFAKILVPIEVQGQFTAILRISYVAFVTAAITPPDPKLVLPQPIKTFHG